MSSTSLYNKYRSRTFAEPDDAPLIGQEHVTRTLRNAVATGQIGHAYLFCGPRGTGKTSAARILARAVNCKRGLRGEPCNECENCQALLSGRQLDLLIEIDGASNRGVDDVRALRERILQRPGGAELTGRFKVYIVDEVHMLTTEAFNALLKSLEEPPSYVIFVLCTTDPQKVPATVASRCQRFDFKPISLETLARHLANVAEAEHVAVEPAALELLARAAAGGARDAVSLLDQALAYAGAEATAGTDGGNRGRITAAQVQAMLGLTDFEAVCQLVDALIARDLPTALRGVQAVVAQGNDLRQFARQVVEFLRAVLLTQSQAAELLHLTDEAQLAVSQRAARMQLADVIRLVKLFGQAEQGLKSPAAQPQLPLELAVVEALVAPAAPAMVQAAPAVALQTAQLATAPVRAARPNTEEAPSVRSVPDPATPAGETSPVSAAPFGGAGYVRPAPATTLPDATANATEARGRSGAAGADWSHQERAAVAAAADTSLDESPSERQDAVGEAVRPGTAPRAEPAGAPTNRTEGATPAVSIEQVSGRWPAVLDDLRRANHRSLEALLRDASPVGVEDGNVVVLSFRFAFHSTKVQEVSNQIALEKALGRVLGVTCKVRCVVEESGEARPDRPRAAATGQHDPVVAKALRIWHGRILDSEERAALDALPELPVSALLNE